MFDILLSAIETEDERELVKRIFETYRQRMYNLAYSILKNSHDAEDAVSAAFVRIMNNLSKISDLESIRTRGFIYTVTRNSALDIYNKRKKNSYQDIDEINTAQDNDVEEDFLRSCDAESLRKALNELNENYKNILLLKYYYDLSIENISLTLGISESAVKHRLCRAREALAGEIGGLRNE